MTIVHAEVSCGTPFGIAITAHFHLLGAAEVAITAITTEWTIGGQMQRSLY